MRRMLIVLVCCIGTGFAAGLARPWTNRVGDLDTRPLEIRVVDAFPGIRWTGWDNGESSGVPNPIRPILLTHAGDHSGRLFVPTQQGVIHVLSDGAKSSQTSIFLDISARVAYDDKTNEEGFLGLAFHPRYADNGQFFVYYTNKARKHQNVLARYRVSKSDANRADAGSEEILLVFDKPFWNHDGGTIVFGPDGYLYVAVGDGGAANDPFGNGQKLNTLLGKILRIDVDHTAGPMRYAIPPDNPFVGRSGARGEIWALGLRNVWRMSFDRQTAILWAGDVGQDTWEEIDLIERGGNYGWNLREGLHPFAVKGALPKPNTARSDLIPPIWEYHHDVGKSITGGHVYRGSEVPELAGAYLYADYIASKMWALRYDHTKREVVANREIPLPKPIQTMSFGEDEAGEVYFMTLSMTPQCVYKFSSGD